MDYLSFSIAALLEEGGSKNAALADTNSNATGSNAMSIVQHVNDSSFETQVTKSDVPVLVDFWAPWCAPCLTLGPVLEQIATEYEGRVRVVKVNVDEEQMVAGSLGVRSIPTVALFQGGAVRDTLIGAHPKDAFRSLIDRHLGLE